jgi:hypothetical protein|eukprot:CAMPEP_0174378922 /NCGR_PEP_ID=MMETSP0811_2-20130205/122365_1 /TAXON_ID=73025 ORGANISM="Eutreptiella gymnastica-like, Strain CCMP1594" /NCGR_SAMPLE_ID=MMETSP0811_2 /ASSEMBLY_ACC=CAM_ASM_000667 /LENGTH=74 /DNA_ID=CAMNT_0015531285 /DNA_START=645 /DNA_END=869 /DNA_ORIENTATION=-
MTGIFFMAEPCEAQRQSAKWRRDTLLFGAMATESILVEREQFSDLIMAMASTAFKYGNPMQRFFVSTRIVWSRT